jgi:hypothetical protein
MNCYELDGVYYCAMNLFSKWSDEGYTIAKLGTNKLIMSYIYSPL